MRFAPYIYTVKSTEAYIVSVLEIEMGIADFDWGAIWTPAHSASLDKSHPAEKSDRF
jgi:hypothetical protein